MSDHKAQEYLAKEAESLERAKLTDDEDLSICTRRSRSNGIFSRKESNPTPSRSEPAVVPQQKP